MKLGTLELLQKARGPKKSIQAAYEELVKAGYAGGRMSWLNAINEKMLPTAFRPNP